MYKEAFGEFLTSADTLRIYEGAQVIFSSDKDRLLPLLEYIRQDAHHHQDIVVFDKVMGNAAALLSIRAGCRKVYSPLGSRLAIKLFEIYGIEYHLIEIVPYVQNSAGDDMCPMEKLSIDKNPEEFYAEMMKRIKKPGAETRKNP